MNEVPLELISLGLGRDALGHSTVAENGHDGSRYDVGKANLDVAVDGRAGVKRYANTRSGIANAGDMIARTGSANKHVRQMWAIPVREENYDAQAWLLHPMVQRPASTQSRRQRQAAASAVSA